mgnify:CR=1 FL=1
MHMADKTRIPVNGSTSGTGRRASAADGKARAAGEKPAVAPAYTPVSEGDAVAAQALAAARAELEAMAAHVEGLEAVRKEAERVCAEAQRDRDDYLGSLQRLQAEFDNFRRRARREIGDASEAARAGLLGDFLPVLDNLERALNAAEHHQEGKVLEGVRLTRSLFVDLLRREGVEEVDPLGGAFDPTMHEAMLARPAAEPEGTVVDVFEKGYTLGDRILRPARVIVSSGEAGPAGATE